MVLFELAEQHLKKALAVLLVIQRRQFLQVSARHVLHQERVGHAVEGQCRDHDHLAMARRHRQRDIHRIRLPHAHIEADAEPALRLRIG